MNNFFRGEIRIILTDCLQKEEEKEQKKKQKKEDRDLIKKHKNEMQIEERNERFLEDRLLSQEFKPNTSNEKLTKLEEIRVKSILTDV